MPFERSDITTIAKRIAGDFQANLSLPNIPPKSVLDVLSKGYAGAVHGLYGYGSYLEKQLFPFSAEKQYLDAHAMWWGVNRDPATKATGRATFTGIDGSAFPKGTMLTAGDKKYVAIESGIVKEGLVQIGIEALEAGIEGNIPKHTPLQLLSPVAGIDYNGTAVTAITGGNVEEDDNSLRKRLLQRVQNPPSIGTKGDYVRWALAREKHGVDTTSAWCYPNEMGIGSVTVRFMTVNGIPSEDEVKKVQEYIESVRPITAEVFVVAPIAQPITFTIQMVQPDTPEVRSAIEKSLQALVLREAEPSKTILISHIREAISIASGEYDYVLTSPTENVTVAQGKIATYGGVTWQ